MTILPDKVEDRTPFELKGSLFTLTVMRLHEADLEAIAHHLTEKTSQAPGFFDNAPVVIDLERLAGMNVRMDFAGLYDLVRERGMVPVGVRNGSEDLHKAAVLAGLPILPEGRAATATRKPDKPDPPPPPAQADKPPASVLQPSKLVTQPVRSGQQIYAPDADLILLEAVSAGAEVLADGNIHVYGPLRGRALAGIKGNIEARIFCQSLEAELVSIAGRYQVSEQMDAAERGEPAQIYLSEERLIIKPLSR